MLDQTDMKPEDHLYPLNNLSKERFELGVQVVQKTNNAQRTLVWIF